MIKKQYRIWMLSMLLSVGLCFSVSAEETSATAAETQTETVAQTETAVQTEPTEAPAQTDTPQTTAPIETSVPQTESDSNQEITEDSSDTITEMPTETQTTEIQPGSDTGTESGTVQPDSNQSAFDSIVVEDENGVMDQETSVPATEGETQTENTSGLGTLEEAEDDTEEITEGKDNEDIEITVEKEKATRWGESLIEFQAYPVGNLSENQAKIYRYLRDELKLNKAAASGVLANIECESNFSTVAVGDGGSSYGLCQWHAGRFSSLVNWCRGRGYDYHLLEGQLEYMKYELETGYTGVLDYLKNVPDTERGAYQAGYYWCMYFEIPSDTVNRSIYRGKMAMNNYFPVDLDKMEEEARTKMSQRNMDIVDDLMLISDPEESMASVTDFCLYMNLK